MSACETCWATASMAAAMFGGSVVDRYRELLADAEQRGIIHPEGTADV